MKALPVKLTILGNSTALLIPATLVRLFDWAAGYVVQGPLIVGGPAYELRILTVGGGKSLGVVVPTEALKKHGLERGHTVEVPFHEWTFLRREEPRPRGRPKSDGAPKKAAKRAAGTR